MLDVAPAVVVETATGALHFSHGFGSSAREAFEIAVQIVPEDDGAPSAFPGASSLPASMAS